MADSKEMRATLLQTATALIDCYNQWTIEAILSLRTDTCKHTVLPATLGVPPYIKADYGPFFSPFMDILSDVSFKIINGKETVVDVEMRKVVIHVKGSATSPYGQYRNEYIFTLTMTEDGKMIEDIVEFADSATALEFFKARAKVSL